MKNEIENGDIVLVPMMVNKIDGEWADISPMGSIPDVDWDYSDYGYPYFWVNTKCLIKKDNEEKDN